MMARLFTILLVGLPLLCAFQITRLPLANAPFPLTNKLQWANLAWSNTGKAGLSKYSYADIVEVDGFDTPKARID